MCYAKPGPRCAGHLRPELDRVLAEAAENRAAYAAGGLIPHPDVTLGVVNRVQEEFDGTMTGQRELNAAIDACEDPDERARLAERRDEAARVFEQKKADLDAQRGTWGTAGVAVGVRTPWGQAQSANEMAEGVTSVSTAGHGGVKLSPERNAVIPAALRNRSGWYEEDCEVSIVGMFHPDAFPRHEGGDTKAAVASFERSVKNYFPDAYQTATGRTVPPEESSVLRERAQRADEAAFRAAHANEHVSVGFGTDSTGSWVPSGYVAVRARVDATGEEREFLVPKGEAVQDNSLRRAVLIDPRRHVDITGVGSMGNPPPAPRPPVLTGDQVGITTEALTPTQQDRAARELNKRWRFSNGDGTTTVETLGEHMERVGVVGKRPTVYGNKASVQHVVEYADGRVTTVSKSAYQALTGVPDISTATHRAQVRLHNAQRRIDRARAGLDAAALARAQPEYDAALAAERAARAAESALEVPWEERQMMRKRALQERLEQRGVTLD